MAKQVEYDDITLIEAEGDYERVVKLMAEDGADKVWMIRSKVFVNTEIMSTCFILNFWNDKKIIIDEILRQVSPDIPNDDIGCLSEWCKKHDWLSPEPSMRLLEDPRQYDFWERQYQSGLINCFLMDRKEEELVMKIRKAIEEENSEEENLNVDETDSDIQ